MSTTALLFVLAYSSVAQTEAPSKPDAGEWKLTPEQEQAIEDDEARNYTEAEEAPRTPRQPRPPVRRALDIMAGLGVAYPTAAGTDGSAYGFTAEVSYVWFIQRWFSPRVYAGTLITGQGDCKGHEPCDIGAQVGFAGGLVHLMAPIPWIGPFFEVGLGASAGSIHTIEGGVVDEHHSGLLPHARLGLGLALGEHNNFEVGLRVIDHFTANNIAGGLMIGVRIPL